MHDPRFGTALRQLTDLRHEPDLSRWCWDIVRLERIGRICLPAEARAALRVPCGESAEVRGRSSRLALVLRMGHSGAPVTVDGRGRVFVPVWLRHAGAAAGVLLVGARLDPAVVVVVPVGVLDGIGRRAGAVTDRRLRATILLAEATALGIDMADLIAAAKGPAGPMPTLKDYLDEIAPTFTKGTSATYGSYWRLAVDQLGDRRLAELTVFDLHTVVASATARARRC
jgi:bifunctional DNA-binding transcriptional regulator/antitoxin component of YhaV-PrlF toxin-antitoxin module